MKKFYRIFFVPTLIISLFLAGTHFSMAQDAKPVKPEEGFSWDRVIVGGNFGLLFGNTTVVDISPLIGYKITERFIAGVGGTYIYFGLKFKEGDRVYIDGILTNLKEDYTFSATHYGGRVFTRYFILDNIFAHGEYEVLNLEIFKQFSIKESARITIGSVLLGGGYAGEIGANSQWFIMLLYNFNESYYSQFLYPNPIIRVGMAFGF